MSHLDDPEWVEVFAEFAEESREQLEEAEATLIAIERERMAGRPIDTERVAALFRTFHTVKGTAGFLDLTRVVEVAHHAENLLARIRSGELLPESDHITGLCEAVDFLVAAIAHVGQTGDDAAMAPQAGPLTAQLAALETGGAAPAPEPEAPPAPAAAPAPSASVAPRASASLPSPVAAPSVPAAPSKPAPAAPAAREVIRVDAARLDALLDMVGELVIAENMTSRDVGEALQGSRGLLQLQRVTRQLQDITMSLRMVPIGGVFRKMHRLVRDLTQKQGKQAELVLVGEDTEVDKSLVDALADPMVHLLRNAIDHGLEPPGERLASGKPACGRLVLEAGHRGGEVQIEIRDDGRGIRRERVLARARERGLVDGSGDDLSDAEVFQLLFEPGFSTAETITDVSGRGVGMDVVKRAIQAFNGRVQVASTVGEGTCMTLRVPLTLAIADGMLLRVGSQRYTVPLLQVRESVPLADCCVTDLPGGGELVELRGRFVPLLRLGQVFGVEDAGSAQPIVVFLEGSDGSVGVLVDEILGQQQTVIKPMPPMLAHVRAASGCCILGDGRVSLILDGNALASIGRARTHLKGGRAA